MIQIRHLYPADDPLIARHVAMLEEHYLNADSSGQTIVHVHGCWHRRVVVEALRAHRRGTRIVFSPHGGLEPWVIRQRRMSAKMSHTLILQQQLARCSYAVIAHGSMETENLRLLGWNRRIETIRNAVITNSITPEAMSQQTQEVYSKVMDSNTRELMTPDSLLLLRLLLKAGITGDSRWVTEPLPTIDEQQWRLLLVYADHENVRAIVDRGLRTMGLRTPQIDTADIKSYLPTDYEQPRTETTDIARLTGIMRRHTKLTLRHFVDLDLALRRDTVDEEQLSDTLSEHRLTGYFRCCLQVLTEQTGTDEGFLPAQPIDDRKTQTIRNQLKNHLRI